jgi:hypothetical protein
MGILMNDIFILLALNSSFFLLFIVFLSSSSSHRLPLIVFLSSSFISSHTESAPTKDSLMICNEAITQWLITHDTSPLTNLPLANKVLRPNHSLKASIQELNAGLS